MHARLFLRRLTLLLVGAAMVSTALGGPLINVTDVKGRTIEIELISLSGESVSFRRAGGDQQFTIKIDQFDALSQELIRKHASQMPAVYPKIEPDVVIGKRRRKDDSWYMVKQEISATVKLRNPSPTERVPDFHGKILFFGQDQRNPEKHSVLSAQSLEASIDPTQTVTREMESFVTSYDSDNKGYGNVGGYQYLGYLLILTDSSGNVIMSQTTTGSIRQQITAKPSLLKEMLKYQQGMTLNGKLEPG